jgi:hypothetical protein
MGRLIFERVCWFRNERRGTTLASDMVDARV